MTKWSIAERIAHKECPLTLLRTFADTWTTAICEEGREIKENMNFYERC